MAISPTRSWPVTSGPSTPSSRTRRELAGARRGRRARRGSEQQPPSADVTGEFDRGPSQAIASICLRCPQPGKPKAFWTDWGPIFYRGRLDGTARLLCIASDPGPTERIAHRTLVGDAGQRVQGFLEKL